MSEKIIAVDLGHYNSLLVRGCGDVGCTPGCCLARRTAVVSLRSRVSFSSWTMLRRPCFCQAMRLGEGCSFGIVD